MRPGADRQVGLVAEGHQRLVVAQQLVEHEIVPAGNEVVGRRLWSQSMAVVDGLPEVVIADGAFEPALPERHVVANGHHLSEQLLPPSSPTEMYKKPSLGWKNIEPP